MKRRMFYRKQVLTRIIVIVLVALLFCSFSVEDVSANTKTRYGRGALGEVMEYTNHLPAVHPLITGNEFTVFYSNSPSSIKLLGKKWRYEYKYSYDQNEYELSFSRDMNYSGSWLDRARLSVTFNKKTGKVKFIDYLYRSERLIYG